MIQSLWKTVWRFLKELGIKPPYGPAIPLLGIYREETKIEKDTCIPLFTETLFAVASFIAQLLKNLSPMQETPVRFLGQEDPLEKG